MCIRDRDEAIKALEGHEVDAPRLKQHNEQLQDYKRELADVNLKLFSLDLEDTDGLVTQHAKLEQTLTFSRKCTYLLLRHHHI